MTTSPSEQPSSFFASPRSAELMPRDKTLLCVVDLQEKLLPVIVGADRIAWNVGRLIAGARALNVAVAASEQYPERLGPTVGTLAAALPGRVSKRMFSVREAWREMLGDARPECVLVVGIETHVCVAQSVFDLLAAGYRVLVAVDAVGSRYAVDHETALRRMETGGAVLTTTEAALFEWCETSLASEFKAISQLVKESPPS